MLKVPSLNSESWFKRRFPVLSTFIPKANAESLTFLLTSAMLGRFAVGLTRCVADWPTLNYKKEQTPEEKTDIVLERVFMEGIGVPASFAAIAVGQNAGLKIGEALSSKSTPWHVVQQLDKSLGSYYKKAMVYTFNTGSPKQPLQVEELNALKGRPLDDALTGIVNPLHKTLYEGAKINRFTGALKELLPKNADIPLKDVETIAHYFKGNNVRTNVFGITGGMVASTLFSGVVWQWLNDTCIRKKIVPPLSRTITPMIFTTNATNAVKPKEIAPSHALKPVTPSTVSPATLTSTYQRRFTRNTPAPYSTSHVARMGKPSGGGLLP